MKALPLIVAVSCLLASCNKPVSVSIGSPAPDFSLAELGGGTVALSKQRGKVVFLNFWATWCASCEEEMPVIESLHKKYRAKGLRVLAPSLDRAGRAPVMGFAARLGLSFPLLLADPKTASAYGVTGLPTAYLIDRAGLVRKRYAGPLDARALENDILSELEASR